MSVMSSFREGTPGKGAALRAFTFVQVCDPQLGMGGYAHDLARFEEAVDEINTMRPDFVLICGDLVHERNNDAALFAFNRVRARLRVPCYCAPGNHDVGNSPTESSLNRYRHFVGADRYWFDHKGVRFVVTNTPLWKSPMRRETEAQERWLDAALAGAARQGKTPVVVGHHPLFTDSPDEPEHYFNLPLPRRKALLRRFEASGAAAVLAGHAHRNLVHREGGMLLVTNASTCQNYDGSPLGYRVWRALPQGGRPRLGSAYHGLSPRVEPAVA